MRPDRKDWKEHVFLGAYKSLWRVCSELAAVPLDVSARQRIQGYIDPNLTLYGEVRGRLYTEFLYDGIVPSGCDDADWHKYGDVQIFQTTYRFSDMRPGQTETHILRQTGRNCLILTRTVGMYGATKDAGKVVISEHVTPGITKLGQTPAVLLAEPGHGVFPFPLRVHAHVPMQVTVFNDDSRIVDVAVSYTLLQVCGY